MRLLMRGYSLLYLLCVSSCAAVCDVDVFSCDVYAVLSCEIALFLAPDDCAIVMRFLSYCSVTFPVY
ncbi:MAG: hypothetical protein ABIG84_07125 [archaeon]